MSYRDKVWRTKDGKYIKICDMSTSHIINTLNMIKNKNIIAEKYLQKELRLRKLNRLKNVDSETLF